VDQSHTGGDKATFGPLSAASASLKIIASANPASDPNGKVSLCA
jgi:hypothetical protein